MNGEILYNKIQLLDNGVWIINEDGQIHTITIPLFVDYSRKKINSKKIVGIIIFVGFLIIVLSLIFLISSMFNQVIGGF